MKIIGKTKEGMILEASENEAANLVGYFYYRAQGCPLLEIGTEIRVHQMYQQLYALERMAETNRRTIDSLKLMQATLETVIPIVLSANLSEIEIAETAAGLVGNPTLEEFEK